MTQDLRTRPGTAGISELLQRAEQINAQIQAEQAEAAKLRNSIDSLRNAADPYWLLMAQNGIARREQTIAAKTLELNELVSVIERSGGQG